MEGAPVRRTLIVANRTAATPLLIEEVRRRAAERPTRFSLLIPNVQSRSYADWTLASATGLLGRAANGEVEGLLGEREDAFESVKAALEHGEYDDVLISTMSKRTSEWLHRDLPHRVAKLGVEVDVISQPAETGSRFTPASRIRA